MPRLSVVVTAYNHSAFIEDAIRSVLDQTDPPDEIIVVDDGSTDDTSERLAGFGHRIKAVRQTNQGVAASRNAGVRLATGDLVAFLDGDDLWEKDKLAHQAAAAREHPDAGLIVVDGIRFSGATVLQDSLLGPRVDRLLPPGAGPVAAASWYRPLLRTNLIPTTSQVMVPRAILDRVGPSNPRFKVANDYDLYLRIARFHDVVVVRRPLMRWRYLATSVSGPEELRSLRWAEDCLAVRYQHLHDAPSEYRPEIREHIRRDEALAAREAYYYGHAVDRAWATRYLLRLTRASRRPVPLVPYVLGLWSPRWVRRILQSLSPPRPTPPAAISRDEVYRGATKGT